MRTPRRATPRRGTRAVSSWRDARQTSSPPGTTRPSTNLSDDSSEGSPRGLGAPPQARGAVRARWPPLDRMGRDRSDRDAGGIDLTDLSLFRSGIPHALFARLRREAPILHPQGGDGGFWSLVRHEDVCAVNR